MKELLYQRKIALIESVLSINDETLLYEVEKQVRIQMDLQATSTITDEIVAKRLQISESDIMRGKITSQDDLVKEIHSW